MSFFVGYGKKEEKIMTFKDNLLRLRKEHNLSQEDLAEKLNVSRQAVSKWETGTATPELANLTALCELFGVTPNELLGYAEVKREEYDPVSKPKINWRKLLVIIAGLMLLSVIGKALLVGLFIFDPDSGNISTTQNGPEMLFDAEFVSIDSMGSKADVHTLRLVFRTEEPVNIGDVIVSVYDTFSGKFTEYSVKKNGVYCTSEVPIPFYDNVIISACHKVNGEISTARELIQIFDIDEKGYSYDLK